MLPEMKFFIYIFNFADDTHEWKLYFYILIGGVLPETIMYIYKLQFTESSLATLWSEELKVPISDEHLMSPPISKNIFFSKSAYAFRDIFTLPKKA